MKMKIWLTEANNVESSAVVDNNKIEERIFDWEDDVQVLDILSNVIKIVKIKRISLFEHLIVFNSTLHKPLAALSKTFFKNPSSDITEKTILQYRLFIFGWPSEKLGKLFYQIFCVSKNIVY